MQPARKQKRRIAQTIRKRRFNDAPHSEPENIARFIQMSFDNGALAAKRRIVHPSDLSKMPDARLLTALILSLPLPSEGED